jgi:tetratricopeptide (TPR) repeat protein
MSITRDQLIQFIEKPGLLREQTIGELKEIVDEFPYFQSAQLLYTYNLYARSNFRYEGYLKTCSIYATDRTVLYQLLQSPQSLDKKPDKTRLSESTDVQTTSLFELAEETQITAAAFPHYSPAQHTDDEPIDFDLLSFDQPDSSYPLEESAPAPDKNEAKADEKIDLIDQFIKVNPTIPPRIDLVPEQKEPYVLKEETENDSDEFITETLSRIYLKQGHYQKAIDSFRRLSLKFPEKSVYFAQQIEEVKKLLN